MLSSLLARLKFLQSVCGNLESNKQYVTAAWGNFDCNEASFVTQRAHAHNQDMLLLHELAEYALVLDHCTNMLRVMQNKEAREEFSQMSLDRLLQYKKHNCVPPPGWKPVYCGSTPVQSENSSTENGEI